MSKDKALKLALEALETELCYVENEDFDNKQKFRGYEHLMPTDAAESIQEIKTAITAIKEALAQPEQEPVVWMYQDKSTHEVRFQKHMRDFVDHGATYETPLYTTPPQLEREPVAWMRDDEMKAMVSDEKRAWILCGRSELIEEYNKPLYTTPPQRTWVGLTEEEVEACFHHVDEAGIGLFDFAEAIEAKLKQKNGYAEEKNT